MKRRSLLTGAAALAAYRALPARAACGPLLYGRIGTTSSATYRNATLQPYNLTAELNRPVPKKITWSSTDDDDAIVLHQLASQTVVHCGEYSQNFYNTADGTTGNLAGNTTESVVTLNLQNLDTTKKTNSSQTYGWGYNSKSKGSGTIQITCPLGASPAAPYKGDCHMNFVDPTNTRMISLHNCKLYDSVDSYGNGVTLTALSKDGNGFSVQRVLSTTVLITGDNGSIRDLNGDGDETYTTTDNAGNSFSVIPNRYDYWQGTVLKSDVVAGAINHYLRFASNSVRQYPASVADETNGAPSSSNPAGWDENVPYPNHMYDFYCFWSGNTGGQYYGGKFDSTSATNGGFPAGVRVGLPYSVGNGDCTTTLTQKSTSTGKYTGGAALTFNMKMVLTAIQQYGMMWRDTGGSSDYFTTYAQDTLGGQVLHGSNFVDDMQTAVGIALGCGYLCVQRDYFTGLKSGSTVRAQGQGITTTRLTTLGSYAYPPPAPLYAGDTY